MPEFQVFPLTPLLNFANFHARGGGGLRGQPCRDFTCPPPRPEISRISNDIQDANPLFPSSCRGTACRGRTSCSCPRTDPDRLGAEQRDQLPWLSYRFHASGTLHRKDARQEIPSMLSATASHNLCQTPNESLRDGSSYAPGSTVYPARTGSDSPAACTMSYVCTAPHPPPSVK